MAEIEANVVQLLAARDAKSLANAKLYQDHKASVEVIGTQRSAALSAYQKEKDKASDEREHHEQQEACQKVFQDVAHYKERLAVMTLKTLKFVQGKYVIKAGKCTISNDCLKQFFSVTTSQQDRNPNNSQYAISACVVSMLSRKGSAPKILVLMPPGLGKTRVLASVVYMQRRYFKVVIAYPSQGLLDNDMAAIQHLKLNNASVDVVCVVPGRDDELSYDDKTLLIMDEADTFLLDHCMRPKAGAIVGLSATAVHDVGDNET